VLPARLTGYGGGLLDGVTASGEFVWLARRTSDAAKPRIAFFRRDLLPLLAAPPAHTETLGDGAQRVREVLARRGASFLRDIEAATGLAHAAAIDAAWELVFAGLATNDSFAPLRHVPRGDRETREGSEQEQIRDLARRYTARDKRRAAQWRGVREDRAGAGRWSLVPHEGAEVGEADRAEAWADILLARYGVLAYEHYAHEDVPVPWSLLSDVLKRREMRGEVRRGSFVAGFQAMQFAHRSAVERLRESAADTRMTVVAATDPANPYGAALPSPAEGFARIAGAYLVLEGGAPVMIVGSGGRHLAPVNGLGGERLAAALATLPQLLRAPAPYRGKRLEVLTYGDDPVGKSPAADALSRAGFEPSGDALVLWPSRVREPQVVVADDRVRQRAVFERLPRQ
jgi:ATP-dependent helicase Lhr and Lhr-like helicase